MDDPRLDSLRRELAHPLSHPDVAELQAASARLTDWVLQHFATLPDRPVGRTASRPQMEALLRMANGATGCPFEQVLTELGQKVAPFAMRVNHPRFLAFIPGVLNFETVLGGVWCAA